MEFVMTKSRILLGVLVAVFCLSCSSTGSRQPAESNDDNGNGFVRPKKSKRIWTDWYTGSTLKATKTLGMRRKLFEENLHDPHKSFPGGAIDCDQAAISYRTADGTCNDLELPYAGAKGIVLGRNVKPDHIKDPSMQEMLTPNPVTVSHELLLRKEFKPIKFLNLLAASWIQFMTHDWLSHGANSKQQHFNLKSSSGEDMNVGHTKYNHTDPSHYKSGYKGKNYTNEVTHWWDGSQIYGSDKETQHSLRSFVGGKFKIENHNGQSLLPKITNFSPTNNPQGKGQELTGFNDNWWVGLSLLHHAFVKEHNFIADKLMHEYRQDWINQGLDGSQIDEKIFQLARLINSAVMAKIHTVEWTPAILPNKHLKQGMEINWYGLPGGGFLSVIDPIANGIIGQKTYKNGVAFSITEEFTSVYRLHSLLPEELGIYSPKSAKLESSIPLNDTRNEHSLSLVKNHGLSKLMYSFGRQHPGELVLFNFPKFITKMNMPGLGNFDLGAIDILRDRERGVPRYNEFRVAMGLNPITEYADFFPKKMTAAEAARKPIVVNKLREVYGVTKDGKDNVEQIDLLVGCLAEEVRPTHFGFGETLFQVFILMASRRLMADRFYTESYNAKTYTKLGIDWVENEGTLAQVIGRHFPELKPKMSGLESAFSPWRK